MNLFLLITFLLIVACTSQQVPDSQTTIRFATFNTSLYRDSVNVLIKDLSGDENEQARHVAEIIQRVRPDVLALQEFDYDAEGHALQYFQDNYLGVSQHGADTIVFPYRYVVPSNTGVLSGLDMNENDATSDPEDAFGFGRHPGQYAFALLSKYPIVTDSIRSFQHFLWKDMPGALLPVDSGGDAYYSEEVLNIFRLSSKNHIDIPVNIQSQSVHVIIAHPTPPVFDGPEDRNGTRNYDEIRLIADYISGGEKSEYLYDDQGRRGGLPPNASFVIMGDMNADPVDGDSYPNAIQQLLHHLRVNQQVSTGKMVPASEGGNENAQSMKRQDQGEPTHDTSVFGLHIDYVLPSANLAVVNSGIYWPAAQDSLHYLVDDNASSDHRLVWVDVEW
jgi:endonuclease/exonuclease/phosphatase family metal-dependent hydrolase